MDDTENNRKLVESFCAAVFVDHDLSALGRYLKGDYIQHNPDVPQGRAGFKKFFETTFKAMPDFRYTVNRFWQMATGFGFTVLRPRRIQAAHGSMYRQQVTNSISMLSTCFVWKEGRLRSTGTWLIR